MREWRSRIERKLFADLLVTRCRRLRIRFLKNDSENVSLNAGFTGIIRVFRGSSSSAQRIDPRTLHETTRAEVSFVLCFVWVGRSYWFFARPLCIGDVFSQLSHKILE